MNRIPTRHYACFTAAVLLITPVFVVSGRFVKAQDVAEPFIGADAQNNPLTQRPRQISSGTATLTIYQPQIDQWQGNHLTGRAAVSVQANATATPVYGVIRFSTRTDVDKEASFFGV